MPQGFAAGGRGARIRKESCGEHKKGLGANED